MSGKSTWIRDSDGDIALRLLVGRPWTLEGESGSICTLEPGAYTLRSPAQASYISTSENGIKFFALNPGTVPALIVIDPDPGSPRRFPA